PRGTPEAVLRRLTAALRAAMADGPLRAQMEALGVLLPQPDGVTPAAVSKLIEHGLRNDVPALKAKGESLN
ncbi:tripartite tricarboxylate transporter substrate binding protein BugD, partial [Bordetella hinzii]|nr:tripartite tricarboxylate transporter substrate binding protein BugD [Bordetella hinzii]